MLHALVHFAGIQDRNGGPVVMATLFGLYPFLVKLYADGGYRGPVFRNAATAALNGLTVEIVRRSDRARGFVVLPKRWVVERTFAWLGWCHCPGKDWKCLYPQGACLPAACVNTPHGEKASQSQKIIANGHLGRSIMKIYIA